MPQNAPATPLAGPNLDPRIDPKQILEHNDSQIHDSVEKLYFLAAQLKAEVERTNSQNVLSLAMVQKCEQIEKYAKQIKGLAKGGVIAQRSGPQSKTDWFCRSAKSRVNLNPQQSPLRP